MAERSISGVAARTAGDFRYTFGRRTDLKGRFRPLKLFRTDCGTDLGEMVFVSGGSCSDFTGDPGAHAIGGFVQSGNGRVAQIMVNERGSKGVAGSHRVRNVNAVAKMFADFVRA